MKYLVLWSREATPDEATLAQLAGIHDRAEICDSHGQVIGHYQPVTKPKSSAYYVPDVSLEELKRYEQEPGGRTLSEINRDWKRRS